ncbi:hypothetical protein [Microbacterium sp. NPDC058389]|uniref:hypothetical protein n=1 Tax=Microbacterium sp. NPDC058389 TaxID=3346475 RepID=UPI0036541423
MTGGPHRPGHPVVWVVLSAALLLVGLVALGYLNAADGTPLVDSPATIIGPGLLMLGGVLSAVLPPMLRTQKDVAETREHVANSHVDDQGNPIIMRDEMDARHRESMAAIAEMRRHVDSRFDAQGADIRGVRRDVGRLTDADTHLDGRITAIDDKLGAHLEWSREYVQNQEKEKE